MSLISSAVTFTNNQISELADSVINQSEAILPRVALKHNIKAGLCNLFTLAGMIATVKAVAALFLGTLGIKSIAFIGICYLGRDLFERTMTIGGASDGSVTGTIKHVAKDLLFSGKVVGSAQGGVASLIGEGDGFFKKFMHPQTAEILLWPKFDSPSSL